MIPSCRDKLRLSSNIKHLREDNGWTQQQLADSLCVLRETISQWECGKKFPNAANIINLLQIFPTLFTGKID